MNALWPILDIPQIEYDTLLGCLGPDTGATLAARSRPCGVCGPVGGHRLRRIGRQRLPLHEHERGGCGAPHHPPRPGRADIANARGVPLHRVRPPASHDATSIVGP